MRGLNKIDDGARERMAWASDRKAIFMLESISLRGSEIDKEIRQ